MSIIPTAVTRTLFRSALHIQKASPNIMFGVGLASVVTSTVLACRATLKFSDALPDMQKKVDDVRVSEPDNNPEDHKKEMILVYSENVIHVVKLYAPAVLIGVTGVGLLTGSHVVLNRRNAGLTAAYAALDKAYGDYRARVQSELGDDKELNLYHGAYSEKLEDADGKKVDTLLVDPNKWSTYARFFDEGSVNWQKSAELNRLFVQCQQTYANHLLHSRGHIFLNEVYDMLGLERSKEGAVVGWLIDNDGDNYIDFGLFEATSNRFINGLERTVILDFNVDGVIFDKIG